MTNVLAFISYSSLQWPNFFHYNAVCIGIAPQRPSRGLSQLFTTTLLLIVLQSRTE